MKQARFKGWGRGATPQRLGANHQCDLTRQGKKFKCSDLSLPSNERCSYCQVHQSEGES